MVLPKLVLFIYNNFENGNYILNLLTHVLVTNEVLNKIHNIYLSDLAFLDYIYIYKNYISPEDGWDILVDGDCLEVVVGLENWYLNPQVLVYVSVFANDIDFFLRK